MSQKQDKYNNPGPINLPAVEIWQALTISGVNNTAIFENKKS
jgi:hypothetical protein